MGTVRGGPTRGRGQSLTLLSVGQPQVSRIFVSSLQSLTTRCVAWLGVLYSLIQYLRENKITVACYSGAWVGSNQERNLVTMPL